jgi:hypothetical protein
MLLNVKRERLYHLPTIIPRDTKLKNSPVTGFVTALQLKGNAVRLIGSARAAHRVISLASGGIRQSGKEIFHSGAALWRRRAATRFSQSTRNTAARSVGDTTAGQAGGISHVR